MKVLQKTEIVRLVLVFWGGRGWRGEGGRVERGVCGLMFFCFCGLMFLRVLRFLVAFLRAGIREVRAELRFGRGRGRGFSSDRVERLCLTSRVSRHSVFFSFSSLLTLLSLPSFPFLSFFLFLFWFSPLIISSFPCVQPLQAQTGGTRKLGTEHSFAGTSSVYRQFVSFVISPPSASSSTPETLLAFPAVENGQSWFWTSWKVD